MDIEDKIKNDINSIKWGREEKVTNLVSKRLLVDKDPRFRYVFKYYMPTSPNKYIIVLSRIKPSPVFNASVYGIDNGKVVKKANYYNDDYIQPNSYFKDPFLDKLGKIASKEFNKRYDRRKAKHEELKNEVKPYTQKLSKEFFGKLKPEIENIAKKHNLKLYNFKIFSRNAASVLPEISFYINDAPFNLFFDKNKYVISSLVNPDEYSPRELKVIDRICDSPAIKEIENYVNSTYKERAKNLLKDKRGGNIRTAIRGENEKKRINHISSAGKLYYEDYFNY